MNRDGAPLPNSASRAQQKKEAARRHNAKLDAPKVAPLFEWFGKFDTSRPVQPHRSGGSQVLGTTRRVALMSVVAAGLAARPVDDGEH